MKSGAMFWALFTQRTPTLVTGKYPHSRAPTHDTDSLVGDAAASYLSCQDSGTRGRCLMSRKDINSWRHDGNATNSSPEPSSMTLLSRKKCMWISALGWRPWTITLSLLVVAMGGSSFLLYFAIYTLTHDVSPGVSNPFDLGFGIPDSRAVIESKPPLPQNGGAGLISSVLISNSPQAIASFLYFLYNSLITSMLLAKVSACLSNCFIVLMRYRNGPTTPLSAKLCE